VASYSEVELGFIFIIATLAADNMLAGFAPGGIRRAFAPPGSALPYVIVTYHAGTDSLTANAYRVLSQPLYQVKAAGPGSSDMMPLIHQAAAQLDRLLGGPPGRSTSGPIVLNSVQVGYMYDCHREQPLHFDALEDGETWTYSGGLYRTEIGQIAT